MQPNYLCPGCGHKGSLTPEILSTILSTVAKDYGMEPEDIEWATQSKKRMAKQARHVAVYLLRMFCAAQNKEINPLFHWDEYSSNATRIFIQAVELMDQDWRFSERVEQIGEKCREEIRKNSMPHAICA
jgi:hypothetical protein